MRQITIPNFLPLKRKLIANVLLLSTTFASLIFIGHGIKTANIAFNKTATQSSTYEGVWKADNAIDGDKSCISVDKDHFSGTNNELNPWWQVDLGRKYPVTEIIVYGRQSSYPVQLRGFQVFISSSASGNEPSIYNNTDYGKGTFEIPVSPYVPGRYVKIVMPGTYRYPVGRDGPLFLCEIEVFSQDLIQEMKHSVSTLMSPKSNWNHINWDKDRAIDDIDAYNPDTCGCCSGTTGNDIPWWELNLGKPFLISNIWIYGRSDKNNIAQSTNLYIYGRNSTNENGNQSLSHGNTGNEGYTYSIKLKEPRLFQYLIIRRWTAGLMTLCEVKMFQTGCEVGHYGDRCLRQCHCSNALACDANTGHCDSCASGWSGDACDSTCSNGTYGLGCLRRCGHCKNNQTCNHVTGHCASGCGLGYDNSDILCVKPCSNGTYGLGCMSGCGHCKNNESCNRFTGYCASGCNIGHDNSDLLCLKPCSNGTYGLGCMSRCGHCKNNQTCDHVTGHCATGCYIGYDNSDILCVKPCSNGFYGLRCMSRCGHCKNNQTCNHVTGHCTSDCDIGFDNSDLLCVKPCDAIHFGEGCKDVCHCKNNATCDNNNGTCPSAECAAGWQGQACNKECVHDRFGNNCSSICHCRDGVACNHVTGVCSTQCSSGLDGFDCNKGRNILRTMTEQVNTSMSSTAHNWTSDLAIDGNVGPDPDACNCCSGTQNSQISWWMVDMGKQFPVNQITVYNRRNEKDYQQSAGFQLYFSNNTPTDSFTLIGNISRMVSDAKSELTFSSTLTRYIKIQRPGVLTLCEVLIFEGECQIGSFGDECLRSCHCADDSPCHAITGQCQSPACKTGWIGTACNTQCPNDTFGDKCTEKCFCAEGTCTNNYGICHGKCRPGYTGSHCNEVDIMTTQNQTDFQSCSGEQSATTLIGGAIGGSAVVLVVIIAIIVVVFRSRKRNGKDSKNDYSTPNITEAQIDTEYDTLDNMNDNQGQSNNSYENERVSAL